MTGTRLLLLLCLSASSGAEPLLADKERTERARAHFEMGRAHFNLGEFEAAVREFEEGYRLKPQPLFLYNLGNAARRAGQPRKALEMFERYLAERPDAPERKEVLSRIDELKKLLAELPPPEPPPASPKPEPPPPEPPKPIEPYAAEPSPKPLIVIAPPPPPPVEKPAWRKDWLGATLCVVGGLSLIYGAIDLGVRYPMYDGDVSLMRSTHDYQTAYDAANRANGRAPYLTADVILIPIGAALIVAGAIRYAILARRR